MQLKDFIYHYAQYCRVNVSAALLVENWFDKEYDEKYGDYLQEYTRLKSEFFNSAKIDTNPGYAVSVMQRSRVKRAYENLYNLMIDGLKKKHRISEAKENTFRERLKKAAPPADDVNFDFIIELRKIEEEEY